MALDVVPVLLVVAGHQPGLGRACAVARLGSQGGQRLVGPALLRGLGDGALRFQTQLLDDGATRFHRIVLLGLGTEIRQVVGRVVDAADEAHLGIDDHDLAVQAAEQLEAARQLGWWIEHMKAHAGFGQGIHELRRQGGRAEAIHRHVDADAALRGAQQHVVQGQAHLVLEEDEGFDQHLLPGAFDRGEHGGKELLAVLQKAQSVALGPAFVEAAGEVRGAGSAPGWGGSVHRDTSAARGAWSDRWAQGLRGSTTGWWTRAPRT